MGIAVKCMQTVSYDGPAFQQAHLDLSRGDVAALHTLQQPFVLLRHRMQLRICTGLKQSLMLQDVVLVRPHMRWPPQRPSSCHGPAMNGHAGGLAAGTPVKPGVQPSSAAAAHPQDSGNAEDRAAHLANGTANNSSDMDSAAAERQPSRAQEQSGFGLFCVFDGHNGRRCAAHMEELICGVRPRLHFLRVVTVELAASSLLCLAEPAGQPAYRTHLQGETC